MNDKVSKKISLSKAFLVGKRLYLRPLLKSDITEIYLSWLNDAEVTRYIETGLFPVTKKDLEEFYKKIKVSKTDIMFAIIDKKHDLHIGNIKLGGINWVHRFADLGIMIGDEKSRGKGYGTEACILAIEYAFKRLNLNKVFLGCHSNNIAAIKTYKKVGFRIEGRLKKMLNVDGKYVDKILMGILQSQFDKNSSIELSGGK